MEGCSSIGRALVSKTKGHGFNSCRPCCAEVAQLVEHLTENQRVCSSSLHLGTLSDSESSNGRTTDFGSVNRGSNPCSLASWGRGVVGLTYRPVKPKIAGSSPVAPALQKATLITVRVAFWILGL